MLLADQSHAAFFSRLMQERIDDDYGDFMTATLEEVDEFVGPAREYIEYISAMISKK